jgi:SAM-dependent methyltransferase
MTDNNSPPSLQHEHWREFYRVLWGERLNFMRELVAKGETHPLRMIRLLDHRERHYRLGVSPDGGPPHWIKNQYNPKASMLPSEAPVFRRTSLRGREHITPFYARTDPVDFLVDFIIARGGVDAVVELGCGFGRNLFNLYYNGGPRAVSYYGGELTETGIAMGQMLAARQTDFAVTFFPFDHTAPRLDALPRVRRALVFTAHSIEQVLQIPAQLLETIAGCADEVLAVHFEPFGFQVGEDLGEYTQRHREFAVKRGWNQNLFQELIRARDRGVLELQFVGTELMLPDDPVNPTSLAVWRSPPR